MSVLTRAQERPWLTRALPGLAAGPSYGRVSVSAAGAGAIAVALTEYEPVSGARSARVWLREPVPEGQLAPFAALWAGPGRLAFDPAVCIDGAGRVVAGMRTAPVGQDMRGPDSVAVAVRQPGAQFGPTRVLTAPSAADPIVATSTAGRAVMAWQSSGGIEAVSIDGGIVGRVVVLRQASSVSEPVIAVGPRGEAVIAWTELKAGPHGHTAVLAAYRGRRGTFGPATVLGRPRILASNNPAVAVDRDGHAVVAWSWRLATRGAPGHRDGIDARTAADGHFSSLHHIDAATSVSGPSAGTAGSGVVLSWSVRVDARGSRVVRAATVRDGSISRRVRAGELRGLGSELVLAIGHGPHRASLVWANRMLGMRPQIANVDASGVS